MLHRTLRQVRAEVGAQRRRRRLALVGAAAVGLGIVLTGGVVIGRETAPPVVSAAPAPSPDAVVLSGTGEEPGVAMTATITPAAGWVRLSATVQGIPPGNACFLYVVAKDGTRHVAGSWLVPQTGWRDGITLDGSAIVPPDQVAAVVVENDQGREFAVLRT
jgi:RNA polymerase sigma-70 factor (ECF subfamily)